jgi:outer membrane protein assembly factor BamA
VKIPVRNKFFQHTKIPFFFLTTVLLIAACNPTRKLGDKEVLLEKNFIIDKTSGLDKAVIETYVRQKPNRKLFRLFYFHTWLYNTVDRSKDSLKKIHRNEKWTIKNKRKTEKFQAKEKRKDRRHDKRNARRLAKGKPRLNARKKKEPKLKKLDDLTFGEKVQEIGEAAVALDTFYTKVSTEQIKKYFYNNGFFNAHIRDSVVFNPHNSKKPKMKKRAHVYYLISAGEPYHVRNVTYKIDDPELQKYIFDDSAACKIKPGQRYQEELISAERERIYKYLINHGYFEFAQDYVYFLVDTNLKRINKLDVKIGVKKFAYKEERNGKDTILFRNHIRYFINNVYLITDYNPYIKTDYKDTTVFLYKGKKNIFLHNGKMSFRKSVLTNLVSIAPDSLYSYSTAEETYRRLSDLKGFKNINVVYDKAPGTGNRLDVVIQMTPIMKQAFTTEVEGTNTSGNLGIAGSLVYLNRNVAHGAELLEIKLKGGLTAQKNFGTDPTLDPSKGYLFNTAQFGPEVNLYFPRMFFPMNFIYRHWGPEAAPKTVFTSSANYQKRPEFGRTLINLSYGFQWKNKYSSFSWIPVEASVINVSEMTASFQQQLENSNDYFLKNSFVDHITIVTRGSWMYNNQNKPKARALTFLRVSLESSGNLLREIFSYSKAPTDDSGRYTIAGIPFAHFYKGEVDYRYYIPVRKTNRLVLRTYFGLGIARINLPVLPYEKSFFAGGPNSVRGWKARSLGPGGNDGSGSANFDKLGDIQMEANIEYRFNIYKMFNGALFSDFGNIWLRQEDVNKPLAHFEAGRFYREIAMSSGIGLRADFSFFIIRLDAACKIYDPIYAIGNRWTFDKKPLKGTVVNFGIGYPF